MVITVDTNIFIGAIFQHEKHCLQILAKESREELVFAMNPDTHRELIVVFGLHMDDSQIMDDRKYKLWGKLGDIIWRVYRINHQTKTNFCVEHPNDNKFIDCAIGSKSQYIITHNNNHLKPEYEPLIKQQYKHDLKIVSAYQFLEELKIIKFQREVNSRRLSK